MKNPPKPELLTVAITNSSTDSSPPLPENSYYHDESSRIFDKDLRARLSSLSPRRRSGERSRYHGIAKVASSPQPSKPCHFVPSVCFCSRSVSIGPALSAVPRRSLLHLFQKGRGPWLKPFIPIPVPQPPAAPAASLTAPISPNITSYHQISPNITKYHQNIFSSDLLTQLNDTQLHLTTPNYG